jgi:hypothetical protein
LKLTAEEVGTGLVEREKNDPRLSYAVLDRRHLKLMAGRVLPSGSTRS